MLKQKYCKKLDTKRDINLDVKIDHIRLNDLPEIARLYEDVFADHFLGHMGQKFLKLFCSQFVNSSTNYGYVAKCNGKSVGFLLGSIDDAPFYQFYRQNFAALALIVVKQYLTDTYVRKHIAKRFGNILAAIKTLFSSPTRGISANHYNTFVPARLLAIGVQSNYRGIGIANKLTSRFCTQMEREGFKKVALSTLPWNERAIHFYRKDGWIQEDSSEASLNFIRIIKPASF